MSSKKSVDFDRKALGFRDSTSFGRVVTYFSTAFAVDGFDLAIKLVPYDKDKNHANVELLFFQDKGSEGRTDVVAALRMHAYQLKQLHDLIGARLKSLALPDEPNSKKQQLKS
jgi:hypothetical protein